MTISITPSIKRIQNNRGISLIEVLLGIAIVTVTAIAFSAFVPKSNQLLSQIQARNFASSTLSSTLGALKQKSYPLIPLTPPGSYLPGNCDCTQANFAQLPNQSQITNGKITYTQSICTNMAVHRDRKSVV